MSKYIETMHNVFDNEISALKGVNHQLDQNQKEYQDVLKICQSCPGRIIFMGIGKTGHVAQKIAATFSSLGTPAIFIHAAESMHGDLGMITKNDLVIIISNSGETAETLATIRFIKKIGAKTIAMTGNNHSSLAKKCDYHLLVHVDKEADQLNLAPTASSTAELVVGDAMACALSEQKNFTKKDFALFHPGGALGQKLTAKKEKL